MTTVLMIWGVMDGAFSVPAEAVAMRDWLPLLGMVSRECSSSSGGGIGMDVCWVDGDDNFVREC